MQHLGPAAARWIGRGHSLSICTALMLGILLCGTAAAEAPAPRSGAEEKPAAPVEANPQETNPHKGGFWERDALTGDWGGARSALEDQGWQLGATYIGEVLGNIAGGVRTGAIYEGRLELTLSLDLAKAAGWSGALFHANAYQIHGRGLSANNLGNNLLVASNIEAQPSTRLFTLWLQQEALGGAVSLRAGQLAADDEFIISPTATIFVNSTFGWPGITAADLPNGGPVYPLATPGARVRVAPNDRLTFTAVVFNGDPAGAGPGNPQRRNASGTSFRLNDGALMIGEAAYGINQEPHAAGLPGIFKLGAWYHTGRFADQRVDGAGLSLANPSSSGIPARRSGDYGLCLVADQMVWREPGTDDQGPSVFLRLAGSPSDRNLVDLYGDAGLSYRGLLPGRASDIAAIGIAYARIGSAASDLDRDARSLGAARPIRDFEAALELTYRAQLAPWWTVQPDFQLILHPGGHVADPGDATGRRAIRNAVLLGLRTAISF